jgi:hypothetical protein
MASHGSSRMFPSFTITFTEPKVTFAPLPPESDKKSDNKHNTYYTAISETAKIYHKKSFFTAYMYDEDLATDT